MIYRLLRPLLFRLDPERAHDLTLRLLGWGGRLQVTRRALRSQFEVTDPRLEIEAFGIQFKNPMGLAAGYDKNGAAVAGLSCLGFGHIEIGTVTLQPQAGNSRPRIHRVPEAGALINSMGFPNAGINALKLPLSRRVLPAGEGAGGWGLRLGINIGKGKDTPLERAAEDYCALLRRVHGRADYVALNISSPNTPGLRQLQNRAAIEGLLKAVTGVRDGLTPRTPMLLKIAPDLNEAEIDDALAAVMNNGIDGVIATNTTLSRDGLPEYAAAITGGLSGAPLRARATEVVRYIAQRTQGKLPIVGVGGIACAADALEKLRAGAWLVQVYTGLVYAGPGLLRQINEGLLEACEREGVTTVSELGRAELFT